MNNNISSAPRIAFALLVLVTLGCGASSGSGAVATAEPTPLPDMSVARIFRQQLPGGFQEIPTDELLNAETTTSDEEDLPDMAFAYVNQDKFQVIVGMSFLLDNNLDRLRFGRDLNDSKDTLRQFAGAMGGKDIHELEIIEGMENLGEQQGTITMLADVEGIPMRIDAAIFQRDMIGAVLLSMTMEGEPSSISFEKLGKLFDQRVQESLASAE